MSNDEVFITRSTAETKDSLVVDGVEYPLVKWKSPVLLTHSTQVKLN